MSDDLTLTVNKQIISGWQKIRVTRGIERCPSDFDIELTEFFPVADLQYVTVKRGDACQIKIGGDLVITGYVNKYIPSIDKTSHTIRVIGRGKCQDLVDCAAEWPGGQITGSSALEISKKLAQPYGIEVTEQPSAEVMILRPIPQLNLILTETAFEIIERTCRYRGLLAYELPDGNLFLSRVGKISMASGLAQGKNVQRALFESSDDHLFSEYHIYRQSVQVCNDISIKGNEIDVVKDENVKRNRKMSIISEGGDMGEDIAKLRGVWEKNRREGRSNRVVATVDSWRDEKGKLWEPNFLAPISLPSLKVQPNPANWIIGEVTYHLDERGTTADLVLMPPEAFTPEPVLLQPIMGELSHNSQPPQ